MSSEKFSDTEQCSKLDKHKQKQRDLEPQYSIPVCRHCLPFLCVCDVLFITMQFCVSYTSIQIQTTNTVYMETYTIGKVETNCKTRFQSILSLFNRVVYVIQDRKAKKTGCRDTKDIHHIHNFQNSLRHCLISCTSMTNIQFVLYQSVSKNICLPSESAM